MRTNIGSKFLVSVSLEIAAVLTASAFAIGFLCGLGWMALP